MRVVLVLSACLVVAYGRVTPDYFPTCKRSDPEIEKCVLNAVEIMRPRFKEGIPSVHIPALDPFTLPTLKIDRTADNMRIKAIIRNIKAVGGSKFKVEKLKIKLNEQNYGADIKLSLAKIAIAADYDIRGSRVLSFDVNGKGHMKSTFAGITVVVKGTGIPVTKDGVEYLKLDKITLRVRINSGHIDLDDNDRNGPAQSGAQFFNSNPKPILDLVNPLIEESGTSIVKKYLTKILDTIPLNELLED